MNENYEQWDTLAPRGLALIGLGISITGAAILRKAKNGSFLGWFLLGTLGLVIVNTGVAIFGEAVKHRTLYEIQLQERMSR